MTSLGDRERLEMVGKPQLKQGNKVKEENVEIWIYISGMSREHDDEKEKKRAKELV